MQNRDRGWELSFPSECECQLVLPACGELGSSVSFEWLSTVVRRSALPSRERPVDPTSNADRRPGSRPPVSHRIWVFSVQVVRQPGRQQPRVVGLPFVVGVVGKENAQQSTSGVLLRIS